MKQDLSTMDFADGSLLLVNKPYGITSFGIVFQIKKWLNNGRTKKNRIKVGHAGTLDPLADGLMIICSGKWTKRINEFIGMDKTYTGSFRLGYTTASYDLEKTPENPKDVENITPQDIETIKNKFIGEIEQLPPNFSAIKTNGKTAYDLAREGKEVNLKPRLRSIHSLKLDTAELPIVRFEVRCSSGTYIRSLAHDIGQELGCGAYLSRLQRVSIGDFYYRECLYLKRNEGTFWKRS